MEKKYSVTSKVYFLKILTNGRKPNIMSIEKGSLLRTTRPLIA